MASFSQVSVKHRAAEFEKSLFVWESRKSLSVLLGRERVCQMDARQRGSESALPELPEGTASLPPSARPEALDQRRCSPDYNVQQNIRIIENRHQRRCHREDLRSQLIYLSGGKVKSFASLSDCLQHSAIATWAHLDPVLRSIREEHPNARNIHFISDGPTSQYWNKTNFYLASTVPFMRGFNSVTWNFTEASHGKGAPDGVGGALKNLAEYKCV